MAKILFSSTSHTKKQVNCTHRRLHKFLPPIFPLCSLIRMLLSKLTWMKLITIQILTVNAKFPVSYFIKLKSFGLVIDRWLYFGNVLLIENFPIPSSIYRGQIIDFHISYSSFHYSFFFHLAKSCMMPPHLLYITSIMYLSCRHICIQVYYIVTGYF